MQPGHDAVVKVDAFPFTRYGTVAAHVVSVATDAIPGDAAREGAGDATRRGDRSAEARAPSSQPLVDLVFEAKLTPDAPPAVSAMPIRLQAGMTVTVEVKTGSRRVIDYLFAPVVEALSTAAKER